MELHDGFFIPTNEYQTPITKEYLDSLQEEVSEQLLEFVTNVPYIRNLISPNRRRAKDMPKDDKGRVIVDFENPHILEDMDYFRPAAKHFEEHGCYTFLRPNPNPNSEFKKWLDEEVRRCREGYVRESDGEWVTGYMYYYMNYCPIMLTRVIKGRKKADRIEGFPETWEGIYLRFHYIYQAREEGHHGIELARRGCSKSYSLASMMAHNLILGESDENPIINEFGERDKSKFKRRVTILTAYQKEYLSDKDGTLSKFEPMINFASENTEFPRLRLRNSSQDMFWQMGYLDNYGRKKGSLNSVMGVSSKDDSGKLRGKRGHIYFEEMGSFPNLLEIFDIVRQGMEEGDFTYGFSYLVGTSAEKESSFESAKTLLYYPEGYNIKSIKNVYDKPKQGKPQFGYFFPAYINRKGCYNSDGVSDVVLALVQLLTARYNAKYSSDPNSVLRIIAELPITPAEAIIKVKNAFFPVVALTERLQQLDLDPKAYDDVYIGDLVLKDNGKVKFIPTNDQPIRQYGVENTTIGAIEIYEMPQKDSSGDVPQGRYILGHDPVDNDMAESSSLSSTFVFDLFTDRIVAEYTGRHQLADDNFETVRLLCLFYNAKCLYESNKKGIFAYFQQKNCIYLLAETPQYLRDMQLVKYSAFGSNKYGVNAGPAINNYANDRIREWLKKEVMVLSKDESGDEVMVPMPQLYTIRGRALLEELIGFDAVRNFDRIRALGMVMLYREGMIIQNGGGFNDGNRNTSGSSLANDEYWSRNYGS